MKSPCLSVGDYLFTTGMESYYHYVVIAVEEKDYLLDLSGTEARLDINGTDLLIRDGNWSYKSKKKIDFKKELEKL